MAGEAGVEPLLPAQAEVVVGVLLGSVILCATRGGCANMEDAVGRADLVVKTPYCFPAPVRMSTFLDEKRVWLVSPAQLQRGSKSAVLEVSTGGGAITPSSIDEISYLRIWQALITSDRLGISPSACSLGSVSADSIGS